MSPTVLFLSPCVPLNQGVGWEQRAFQFLKGYAQVADIELICLNFSCYQPSATDIGSLQNLCLSVEIYEVDQFLAKSHWPAKIRRLLQLKPFVATAAIQPSVVRRVQNRIAAADAVHAFRLEPFSLVPPYAWAKTFLDLDECHVTTWRRLQSLNTRKSWKQRLQSSIRYLDSYRMLHYQSQAVHGTAAAFACSETERRRIGLPQVQIIPNIAQRLPQPPQIDSDKPQNLLFVGNLSGRPNVDAVLFLVNQIWPTIFNRYPHSRLLIAGRTPCEEILALAGMPGLELHCDVPDLGDLYQKATVALVPIRYGAGTKLKLLEAFGYGVPVVSTSLGCEGVPVQHGEHLLVANSPDFFAEACCHLLADPGLRQHLASAGWDYVRRCHDAIAIQTQVAQIYTHTKSWQADLRLPRSNDQTPGPVRELSDNEYNPR